MKNNYNRDSKVIANQSLGKQKQIIESQNYNRTSTNEDGNDAGIKFQK